MTRELEVEIEGKFFGKIKGVYRSSPVIVTPDIPACNTVTHHITKKIRRDKIVVTHTNENGEINIKEHTV